MSTIKPRHVCCDTDKTQDIGTERLRMHFRGTGVCPGRTAVWRIATRGRFVALGAMLAAAAYWGNSDKLRGQRCPLDGPSQQHPRANSEGTLSMRRDDKEGGGTIEQNKPNCERTREGKRS